MRQLEYESDGIRGHPGSLVWSIVALGIIAATWLGIALLRANWASRLSLAGISLLGAILALAFAILPLFGRKRPWLSYTIRERSGTLLAFCLAVVGAGTAFSASAYFFREHLRNPPIKIKCQSGLSQGTGTKPAGGFRAAIDGRTPAVKKPRPEGAEEAK